MAVCVLAVGPCKRASRLPLPQVSCVCTALCTVPPECELRYGWQPLRHGAAVPSLMAHWSMVSLRGVEGEHACVDARWVMLGLHASVAHGAGPPRARLIHATSQLPPCPQPPRHPLLLCLLSLSHPEQYYEMNARRPEIVELAVSGGVRALGGAGGAWTCAPAARPEDSCWHQRPLLSLPLSNFASRGWKRSGGGAASARAPAPCPAPSTAV